MNASRLTVVLLFALLMAVPLPFLPEFGGANSSTRLMLTGALVEEHTTRIDRHAAMTVDKAQAGDHFYSDKAPGMALLSLPAYAAGRALAPQASDALFRLSEPLDVLPRGTMMIWRAIVWTTGGLLMALAGCALYRMGLRFGASPRAALMASLSVCLATPVLGWSVQLFGHVGAGAALAIGFALSTGLGRGDVWLSAGWRAGLAGVALSLAVSIEYTAAPPALMVALYALWRLTSLERNTALRLLALALVAAFAAAAPMLIYHWISFGSPFRVGYSNVVGFEGMQEGFLGLTAPDPVVLWHIIFGFRRGILWLSPLLVLVPWGIWLGLRAPAKGGPGMQVEMSLCIAMILYYFLLNASYFYWGGGASVGPRHTMPAVFFMTLPLLWLWNSLQGRARQLLQGLFALSLFFSLACAVMTMAVPGGMRFPLKDPILENLLTGQNAFFRMANWGLSPALVFVVWLGLCGCLAALLARRTRP